MQKKKKKEWSQRIKEMRREGKSLLYKMILKCTAVAQISKLEILNNQASPVSSVCIASVHIAVTGEVPTHQLSVGDICNDFSSVILLSIQIVLGLGILFIFSHFHQNTHCLFTHNPFLYRLSGVFLTSMDWSYSFQTNRRPCRRGGPGQGAGLGAAGEALRSQSAATGIKEQSQCLQLQSRPDADPNRFRSQSDMRKEIFIVFPLNTLSAMLKHLEWRGAKEERLIRGVYKEEHLRTWNQRYYYG